MIESSPKPLLPCIYLHTVNVAPKSTFNGKMKVSVRKVIAPFGLASGVVTKIAQLNKSTAPLPFPPPMETHLDVVRGLSNLEV